MTTAATAHSHAYPHAQAHAHVSARPSTASDRAVASLVLGILGIVFLPLFGPFAWYLAHHELEDIRNFRAPHAGQGIARAGWILGIIGSLPLLLIGALLVLAIPVVFFIALFA